MLFIREPAMQRQEHRARASSSESRALSKPFMKKAPRGAFFLPVSDEPYQARMAITLTV
jgi:hypothetical protein